MREARDVAARTRKALDDALSHRIDDVHEDDRHRSALAPNSPHDRNADRDHDFGAGGEELRGDQWPAPSVSGQPAQDELGILARDPADLVQGFAHCGDAGLAFGIVLGERLHQADAPHPLLRAGRKR